MDGTGHTSSKLWYRLTLIQERIMMCISCQGKFEVKGDICHRSPQITNYTADNASAHFV